MRLYHGTSASAAKRAWVEGLKPRGRRKGNWQHTVNSHPKAVYLTDTYAPYFAMATDEELCAVIEVDTDLLDEFDLVPDEDALEAARRGAGRVEGDMRTRVLAAQSELLRYRGAPDFYRESLAYLGNCAHIGPIPPEAITRIAFFDRVENREWRWRAMDATISRANKLFCGPDYQHLNALLFGREGEGPPAEGTRLPVPFSRDHVELWSRSQSQ